MTTYTISLDSLKNSLKQTEDRLPMIVKTPESFTRFKITGTNQYFYYSNYDNGLYNDKMQPLSQVTEPDEHYQTVISETRSRVKSNKPYWIRVLLGHACNYSCTYCLQKDIGNPDEREKITTTDRFVEQIENLDLSRLARIDLWGGETLLYWKTIEQIMTKFDREGLEWFIPTNGTPLQIKHIEFFRTLKSTVGIGLSHDGPGHVRLRGEEFLHKKVDVLKAIQESTNIRFSFNPVISKTNYDIFAINKFFYDYIKNNGLDLKKVAVTWTVARVYDELNEQNSADHVITGDDLGKFRTILRDYMQQCSEQKFLKKDNNILNNSLFDGQSGVIQYIENVKKQILPTLTTSCGVDDEGVLSVDMKGNVRTCPHTSDKFIGGHLDELEKVKLKKIDLNRYETKCKSCEVFRLCKSNCPIEVPDEVFYINCGIEKVFNREIQLAAFKLIFGSEVIKE
jgi:uncharacterized protein